MLKTFLSRWLNPAQAPREEDRRFENIMSMANAIAAHSPQGLHELITALLRPLQAEHMVSVAELKQHEATSVISYMDFFFPLREVANITDFYLRSKPQISVNLAHDVVLATPWQRGRYADALGMIGTGKMQGAWE